MGPRELYTNDGNTCHVELLRMHSRLHQCPFCTLLGAHHSQETQLVPYQETLQSTTELNARQRRTGAEMQQTPCSRYEIRRRSYNIKIR